MVLFFSVLFVSLEPPWYFSPSDETLNRGSWLSVVIINPRMSFEKEYICPLASDHHGLLIIPYTDWLHHSLLSTSKLVCGGRSDAIWLPSHHPGACCTLLWTRRFPPLLCKALWVPRKALYKCNKLLLLFLKCLRVANTIMNEYDNHSVPWYNIKVPWY